ncbi:MAG: hypothetical protein ACE14T_03315 [Syntrophales bacterium]
MTIQNELFDLLRDKQELDIFLSRFSSPEEPAEPPEKNSVSVIAGETAETVTHSGKEKTEIPASAGAIEGETGKKAEKRKTPIEKPPQGETRKMAWGSWKRSGILFIIFAATLQAYLWINPEAGYQTVHWIATNIPVIDRFLESEQKQATSAAAQLKVADMKQYIIRNDFLGSIRIIEGNAVNVTTLPLGKIRVIGFLYNARKELLTARVSYCGNLIPYEQLARLSEEEIRLILSNPPGGLSNDKVLPGGHIPFMIVFTREPAGVEKAAVMPLSAEEMSS